ncbi:complex III assembly factor LYRM7 [Chrysoperla carnea]|uniref:complex III assembly factor LYRM7 n=1 Tax=Chrysoperla carnea TaxID=189513 RepID=UPI001D0715E0|nr:complex III assembly factor LYRM7 [Chrysoperla carnea]
MSSSRSEVLKIFKMLHRTRQQVFDGDLRALNAGRDKINLEFKQKKHVSNEESINELLKLAKDVNKELRESVIQAREVKPNVYAVKITEETYKFENSPFQDIPEDQLPKRRTKKCKK